MRLRRRPPPEEPTRVVVYTTPPSVAEMRHVGWYCLGDVYGRDHDPLARQCETCVPTYAVVPYSVESS